VDWQCVGMWVVSVCGEVVSVVWEVVVGGGSNPPGIFWIFRLSEITSGAFSCHLWKDHITCADTLLVEGSTKHIEKKLAT